MVDDGRMLSSRTYDHRGWAFFFSDPLLTWQTEITWENITDFKIGKNHKISLINFILVIKQEKRGQPGEPRKGEGTTPGVFF